MTYSIDRLVRGVATASILSVLALGSLAASASPLVIAQATTAPAPGQQQPPAGNATAPVGHSVDQLAKRVEARIADLHKKLKITAAQEPQFTAVADAMRSNAHAMDSLLEERSADMDRTAVASLRWYERLTNAHAAALKTFVPAFDALYSALSDSQRKTADTMFQRFAERPSAHKSK